MHTHTMPIHAMRNHPMRDEVKRRMALAMLPPVTPITIGSITLLPHQVQAVHRLKRALSWFHGALLADDVGLGKTFTALAIARDYDHVHVLAPAGLLDMWRSACTRTGLPHVHLHSLHTASRRPLEIDTRSPRTLVIIDEAHALRNPATARYRHVAAAVSGGDVLLLSATPLHNERADLSALVGLFWGERTKPLTDDHLAQIVVRRDARTAAAVPQTDRRADAAPPRIRTHRPIVMPQHRATLDRIMALPAPLPARDGAVAGALIRMGLLRAWCSSDAALTQALTRRILRSEALRAALHANRHPTQQELRDWALGDDHMQLAFPELMTAPAPELLPPVSAVQQHISALEELRALHVSTAKADEQRARVLRALRRRHPHTPIVAFSQYTRTVQALYRALSDIAGVGMVAGNAAQIASGRIPRAELLEHFAPRAHGRPPPPPHRAIMLLITTDMLAEGVNLQDAGIVVHLDMPWTPALRTQRVGRVARIGSPHAQVAVYRLTASTPLRRALRIEARLTRKLLLTRRFVGGAARADACTAGRSAADVESTWINTLQRWTDGAAEPAPATPAFVLLVGEGTTTSCGTALDAMILVRTPRGRRVLSLRHRRAARVVSTRTLSLLRLAARIDAQSSRGDVELPAMHVKAMQRIVDRWWNRRCTASLLSTTPGSRHGGILTTMQQRGLRWLHRAVARSTSVERAALQREITEARRCIECAHGAAALDALERWMEPLRQDALPLREQLVGWRAHPVLVPGRTESEPDTGHCVIEAILAITLEA